MTLLAPSVLIVHPQAEMASPVWGRLRARFLAAFYPIMSAQSRKQVRRLITEAVSLYAPLKIMLLPYFFEQSEYATGENYVTHVNTAILGELNASDQTVFLRTDREIILEVTKFQAGLASLETSIPEENRLYLLFATVDGLGDFLALDVALSSVLLITSGQLKPERNELPHWLCLEMKLLLRYLRTSLFLNNPLLQERLATTGKTITLEEMEHRLGLFQCDGPSPTGKGDCDRYLCAFHRTQAGVGVDYCIEHATRLL